MKAVEQHFIDWEREVFGFGYGSGEEYVLGALRSFLLVVPESGAYDYRALENAVTPAIAWLLINVLAHDDKIDYGSSPRHGWLTLSGQALRRFVASTTASHLVDLAIRCDRDYTYCYPRHCNCGDSDCRPNNPFWLRVSKA